VKDNYRFMRDIWIFNEEEKGFGFGGSPGGYIKIEVHEGKGKIYAMVQNLRETRAKESYDLYLVKIKNQENFNIKIGSISIIKGRGELTWSFDSMNVGGSSQTIIDFNAVVLLYNEENNKNMDAQCPMIAYRKEKVRWKDAFNVKPISNATPINNAKLINNATPINNGTPINNVLPIRNTNPAIDELYNKYIGKIETKYSLSDSVPEIGSIPSDIIINDVSDSRVFDNNANEDYAQDDEARDNDTDKQETKEIIYPPIDENYEESVEPSTEESVEENIDQDTERNAKQIAEENVEENVESTFQSEAKSNDQEKNSSYIKRKKTSDISKLIKLLDKEFKRCDPFNSRRRDYRWWNINSPVNLINVLEQCDINVPRFFSPSVVMSYFKYRYLVAGVYISRRRGREYFVCGIPGTHNIDESPFGNLCRWVQVERNNKEYGSFGYWVTYIDPNTGELLKFN